MDNPPVVGEVLGRGGNDIEARLSDLLDFSRSNGTRKSSQAGPRAEDSAEVCGCVCWRSPDQDGDARGIEFRLSRFQTEVLLIASTNPVNDPRFARLLLARFILFLSFALRRVSRGHSTPDVGLCQRARGIGVDVQASSDADRI